MARVVRDKTGKTGKVEMSEDPFERMFKRPIDRLPIFKEAEEQENKQGRFWKIVMMLFLAFGVGYEYATEGLKGILFSAGGLGFILLIFYIHYRWEQRRRRKNPMKYWRM